MSDINTNDITLPVAPLKIAALESCIDLAEQIDRHLVELRNDRSIHNHSPIEFKGYKCDSYLLKCKCPRFGSGEAKGMIMESVRGDDVFVMTDVGNYSLTYNICGHVNHMSPDDHYQDMKRIIATAMNSAKRVNVIMPFMYEGRQHKRTKRESLDCALALQELVSMGVSNIITFDAHDPRVANAIPLNGFDNYMPPYQFMRAVLRVDKSLKIDKEHLMVVSPDEGGMNRAVYFANVLGVDMGMFYKRRDYSTIVNGKNPIVAHEFLGTNVEGKDVIIVDDMISSGESMLDVANKLKDRKAGKVFICTTFGLFTDGLAKFDEYSEKGYFDAVITTNLTYRSFELKNRCYYLEADMSKFMSLIIDTINHDYTTENVMSPTERIKSIISKYYNNEAI
ncbi:MAG: ribose-phosphate pyrophosphokinase [Lachnospiraceae bacterium]|nr:ribose-phosphate pyrophosphokinase [Lachnospiraceae bacterium]